jgi:hypothetical protein
MTSSLSLSRHSDAGGAEETLYNATLSPQFIGPAFIRTVDLSGVLEPGYVYRLDATAAATRTMFVPIETQIGASSAAAATFTLTTVPEPAAAGVLALSATLLLRRRRV